LWLQQLEAAVQLVPSAPHAGSAHLPFSHAPLQHASPEPQDLPADAHVLAPQTPFEQWFDWQSLLAKQARPTGSPGGLVQNPSAQAMLAHSAYDVQAAPPGSTLGGVELTPTPASGGGIGLPSFPPPPAHADAKASRGSARAKSANAERLIRPRALIAAPLRLLGRTSPSEDDAAA